MDVLLFLNGVLLSRLVYIRNDEHLSSRTLITVGLVQVALCLLVFAFGWRPMLLAALTVLVLIASEYWLPNDWLNENRFLGFVLILIATAILGDGLTLAPWLEITVMRLVSSLWGVDADTEKLLCPGLWFFLGFLLVANEANLLIRSLFHRFCLEPRITVEDVDQHQIEQLDLQEYNAGRVIGILERWLMYSVLMVSQNFNVIALIIAAKGFARFRQMEERSFAEYVLIGTLSSMLLTVLVAQIIGVLRDGWFP